ncbi:hypothetical protein BCIN_12g05885 [Botrytis cinerea B05.10]|uniref:Uncharacterized protein n=1 Tax=Botryotinia fuckeliana (strain B05.10) TaxID=332648 RepID=A0A384JZW1_BOTFB|nr:hypothetical protein BCIN_12g05885 [Botrytis cinerea B05.10]ATZ56051.1 hypothetical protein BCIN_12g05885 [Botrytis cinerea B05.10]
MASEKGQEVDPNQIVFNQRQLSLKSITNLFDFWGERIFFIFAFFSTMSMKPVSRKQAGQAHKQAHKHTRKTSSAGRRGKQVGCGKFFVFD